MSEPVRILYAADAAFRELLDLSLQRTEALGYDCKIYDLGGLGMGERWLPVPKSELEVRKGKPQYMQRALAMVAAGPVCWLDADSFLLDRIDEIGEGCDIAIPLLPKGKVCASPVWINQTDEAYGFMSKYIEVTKHHISDMYGLRSMFPKDLSLGTVTVWGAKVKLLDPAIYIHKMRSCPGDPEWREHEDVDHVPPEAKVIHISPRGFRPRPGALSSSVKEDKDVEKLRLFKAYNERH